MQSNTDSASSPDFASEAELANLVNVKVAVLCNWRSAGRGPPYVKLSGRRVVYPRKQLERWIQEQTVVPTSQQAGTLASSRKRRSTAEKRT